MDRILRGLLALLAMCGVLSAVPAVAEELTGTQVISMMRERPDGNDRQGTLTMTLVNRRGSQRVRVLEQVAKDYGMDRKSLITFRSPADVEGTRFLSWTYDEPGKDDDKWLYVPSMKKVRRISGAANNDFFMGSDFTYDDIDMGRRNISKDTHTLLGEEKHGEYDCWKKGLTRVYDVLKLQEQQGFWSVQSAQMNNIADEHKTLMEFGPFTYDQGLEDSLFQVAVLQRGSR